MGMRSLEAAMLAELRMVARRSTIRQKDVMEWSTGEVKTANDETLFRLPDLGINVAVKTSALGKRGTVERTQPTEDAKPPEANEKRF